MDALLTRAVRGEAATCEALLHLYRPYLRLVAGQRLPRIVQQRVDASDIVQQTLVDAVRGLPEFRGQTEPEFTAWMMKLLERNLLMSVRTNTLGKRDIRLEQNWTDGSGSAVLFWQTFATSQSSPTSGMIRGEAGVQLSLALEKLPDDQRMAVEMRYIRQQTLKEISDEMGRTVGSVTGPIRRGVEARRGLPTL